MSNFFNVEIGELGKTITGKTPSSKHLEDFGNEYMFVTPSDDLDTKTLRKTHRYVSQIGLDKLKGKILPPQSVLVSCIGSAMGKVVINDTTCLTNQQINSIIVNDNYDVDYIYYSLKNNYKLLRNAATGSTALPLLNKTDFDIIKVKVHKSKEIQKRIAKVLSDLDAKIELNNKINHELEAKAKTLYDYWFVQFDFPTPPLGEMSAEQRGYKSSGGKMVYNKELKRKIPEGWEVKRVGEVLNTDLGGTPSTKIEEYWNGEFPWLNSGEIANFPIIDSEEKVTELGITNSATTLMPKGTCVLSITRHLRPSILGVSSCANQSVVGLFESGDLKSSYIYPYLINEIPRLMILRTGAQQPHINKGIVDESLIIIPIKQILNDYYSLVNSMYKIIINNTFENQQLSKLRDWLLPMLMNGQVTVGEVN